MKPSPELEQYAEMNLAAVGLARALRDLMRRLEQVSNELEAEARSIRQTIATLKVIKSRSLIGEEQEE